MLQGRTQTKVGFYCLQLVNRAFLPFIKTWVVDLFQMNLFYGEKPFIEDIFVKKINQWLEEIFDCHRIKSEPEICKKRLNIKIVKNF